MKTSILKRVRLYIVAIILFYTAWMSGMFATEVKASEIEDTYYLHEGSNVDTIHATAVGALPCIGEAKILVFYVDFKNGDLVSSRTTEELEEMFFSEKAKERMDLSYGEEDSLRSFYYRSSYGRVDITGDVYEYVTKEDTSYYQDIGTVLDEIIEYYRDTISWDDYDGNQDGCIDGIYVVARKSHSFGGPNFVGSYHNKVASKEIKKACFLTSDDLATTMHETCHMFGPADMYAGVCVNPSGVYIDCIMDGAMAGDLPSPTKFVLGWLNGVKFIDSENCGAFNLKSYDEKGDVLIIYPEGDSDNRNWFFVEYMKKNGMNPFSGEGIRVWRTQMNLDEKYNVSGATETTNAMINSPYEFLEVMHPEGVRNYCMGEGDSLTPYTYPSTAYSDTFQIVGGAKSLKDLTFSGISVEFLDTEGEFAVVKVSIDNEVDSTIEINTALSINSSENTSAFLDKNEGFFLGALTADVEMNVSGKVQLVSTDGKTIIPLDADMSNDKRSLQMYVNRKYLTDEYYNEYRIKLSGVKTYYGKEVVLADSDEVICLSHLPVSYQNLSGASSTGFPTEEFAKLSTFKNSAGNAQIIYWGTHEGRLMWSEINPQTKKVTNTKLKTPDGFFVEGVGENMFVWKDDGYYYVYSGEYICCYNNKKLVDYVNINEFEENVMYAGAEENSYFVGKDTGKVYRLINDGANLSVESVEAINKYFGNYSNGLQNALYCGQNGSSEVYRYDEEKYIIKVSDNWEQKIYFVDSGKITFFATENKTSGSLEECEVRFVDDKIYIIEGGKELYMHIYDSEFDFLEKRVLLKGLDESTWGPFSMDVEYIDDTWVVSMETVFNSNAVTYGSTSIVTFDEKGSLINYYRYGDPSYRYVCEVMPISKDELLCVSANNFQLIGTKSEVHRHSWDEGVITKKATSGSNGIIIYTCDDCGKEKEIEFGEKMGVSTEEIPTEELKFSGASLTLQDNLTINWKVKSSLFAEGAYDNPYVVFKYGDTELTVTDYSLDGDDYVFTFADIAPHQMKDTITATLYATYDDVECEGATRDYSVATYAYNMLEKCSDDSFAEFRTLLADLLIYGEKSQLYKSYRIDDLASAEMTDEQRAWATNESRELVTVQNTAYETVDNPTVTWKGAGLNLTDRVEMRFKIAADDITNLSVKVSTEAGKTWMIPSSGFEVSTGGTYDVFFNGLNAGQMSLPIYAAVYDGDTVVSNTICYSIESYAYAQQGKADELLLNLLDAMMKYGDSAYNYAN